MYPGSSIIHFITNAIFHFTVIAVPILLVLHFLKTSIFKLNGLLLVQAVNIALILGSLLYIATLLLEFFVDFFSGAEYIEYSAPEFTPHPLWLYPLIGFISYVLIPQLLWIKKFRRSIMSTAAIVIVWILLRIVNIIILITTGQSWGVRFSYTLPQLAIYIVIVAIVYFVLSRTENFTPTSSEGNEIKPS